MPGWVCGAEIPRPRQAGRRGHLTRRRAPLRPAWGGEGVSVFKATKGLTRGCLGQEKGDIVVFNLSAVGAGLPLLLRGAGRGTGQASRASSPTVGWGGLAGGQTGGSSGDPSVWPSGVWEPRGRRWGRWRYRESRQRKKKWCISQRFWGNVCPGAVCKRKKKKKKRDPNVLEFYN